MPAPGANGAHLQLEGVGARFGSAWVIAALDLSVRKGEMVALLGPSGCGKTSTLRVIAGLHACARGRISVGGRDITQLPVHERGMGMVFQSYALFAHMDVARNVQFGLEMRKLPAREVRARTSRALEMVRLAHLAQRKPRELSGGQQQRVALARALVIEPAILLLDEPLSNLDAKLRDEMRVQIRALQQDSGITAVFVTHDQVEALSMCDRVVVMRAGRIEQLGTPAEVYERPASAFVANFVGRTNKLKGRVDSGGRLSVAGHTFKARGTLVPGAVDVLIRPHRIHCTAWNPGAQALAARQEERNSIAGTVTCVSFAGDLVQYGVRCDAGALVVEQATQRNQATPAPGSQVLLDWCVQDTLVYPESGE